MSECLTDKKFFMDKNFVVKVSRRFYFASYEVTWADVWTVKLLRFTTEIMAKICMCCFNASLLPRLVFSSDENLALHNHSAIREHNEGKILTTSYLACKKSLTPVCCLKNGTFSRRTFLHVPQMIWKKSCPH